MSILSAFSSKEDNKKASDQLKNFLADFSIEVMPRTASKIESFKEILPQNTRVYIAHIEGVPIEEMVETAKRISGEGFAVMPHFPARIIKDQNTLEDWINRYQNEAGIEQALLLAGGVTNPHGDYTSSMQLVETELFEKYNFKHLHFAGHPEGNKDIDPDSSNKNIDQALSWKQKFQERTDINLALTTQFCFEASPVIEWADSLIKNGIDIPVHIGVAGPAKLQTLIKFSIACGVGPSLRVLQKRAKDVKKLLLPFEPNDFLETLAEHKKANPSFNITNVHFFPLGGINVNASWIKNATNN
ncbi:MAG: methylenetetrahydrofolate reductase [Candidatus Thioglobus sp.]|jgi:methylenetetrahydrofolate reductase (NADPH)|nr:methylenetetrahydrofolate reductase [Candidatus Pseudothioglobus singularis]MDG1955412.1 methylenetetrahydrofolate reductase [Candidatus Thioglobus sp.]|tara:strand:- start:512 stop:1414 length:903 start_codon:yes stop_codon:yes gene_type:complete